MIKRSMGVPALIACMCLVPALARAQKVSADYDKEVNFSKYKTYAWEEGESAPSPLTHKRIVAAIDEQLAAKGMAKTDTEPSAIIVYYAGVDVQRQLNAWGSGPRWSGIGTVTAERIYVGQLVVDIYDAASGQLVWRGFASDTASDKPEKNQKKVKETIAKLFKEFPPSRSTDK